MRRLLCTGLWFCFAACVAHVALADTSGEDAARNAMERFGKALMAGDATLVQPIMPASGKVKLKLQRLGPEEGSFSASQVTALLADFLEKGRVEAFTVTRVDHDPHGLALASARVSLMDKESRAASINLHLTFQTENDRWVVREIRETAQ